MYTLHIPKDFAQAIEWHGGRYSTTGILAGLLEWCPDPDRYNLVDYPAATTVELEEHEAWELKDAWVDDGGCFACGSPAMNSWFQEFIDTIV